MFGVSCYKVHRKPFVKFDEKEIVCKLFDYEIPKPWIETQYSLRPPTYPIADSHQLALELKSTTALPSYRLTPPT